MTNSSIPRSAFLLGLAGLLPFLIGAGLHLAVPASPAVGGTALVHPYDGITVLTHYGTVILSFMSGVLWGFAARAPEGVDNTWAYALSTIPALWVFVTVGWPGSGSLAALTVGFIGLLVLDWLYARNGLAPAWWMKMRLILTLVVVVCLLVPLLV